MLDHQKKNSFNDIQEKSDTARKQLSQIMLLSGQTILKALVIKT